MTAMGLSFLAVVPGGNRTLSQYQTVRMVLPDLRSNIIKNYACDDGRLFVLLSPVTSSGESLASYVLSTTMGSKGHRSPNGRSRSKR
ncbi:hypothetical protein PoB_003076900 [Plakobranchus ocellatus]|uniref:Uncharacterized protein n=1 Tax=Plakobranchus ocellatus TaxID=259542 RepID=A0AAV4A9B8_9GAST|nr:hypothetical protein PoB_003076900 [Plakobranchus ocellatus]